MNFAEEPEEEEDINWGEEKKGLAAVVGGEMQSWIATSRKVEAQTTQISSWMHCYGLY